MSDPISKVGQSVTERVLTEAQKASGQSQGSDFASILNEKLGQVDQQSGLRQQILQAFGMEPESSVKAISAEGLEIQPSQISGGQEIRTQGKVVELLSEVNRGALQMDNLVELIGSGKTMSPQGLLAAQASLASNVFGMEIVKSCAEQGSTGVKTVLNTNFA